MGWWLFCHSPLIERAGVLRHRRRRRIVDVLEEGIEGERGLLCEVLEVLLHIAVVDGEEAQLIVLEAHEMGDMQRPDGIRRCMGIVSEWTARPASRQSPADVT